jgi:hypothetical protein
MICVSLVGATGSGKSETGNFLIKLPAFQTSDSMTSCTDVSQFEANPDSPWEVFDNPGFNHNRLSEEDIKNQLINCGFHLTQTRKFAAHLVDAFVLVVKATPRLSTIVSDLRELSRLYGKDVLKSVVVLVITVSRETSQEAFVAELADLTEVHNIFKAVGASLIAIPWDNKNPREGMEDELARAIESVVPYTSETFFKCREEVHKNAVDSVDGIYKKEADQIAADAVDQITCVDHNCDALAAAVDEPKRGIAAWFFSPITQDIKATREEETKKVVDFYEEKIKKLKENHQKCLQEMRHAHAERLEQSLQEIEKLRQICKDKASSRKEEESNSLAAVVVRAIESLFNVVVKGLDLYFDFRRTFRHK